MGASRVVSLHDLAIGSCAAAKAQQGPQEHRRVLASLAVQPAACRRRPPATRAGRRQRCGGPPALEHLSMLRLVQGARRRTPWPAPPAVGDVMLKLERRGRGLITRGDHEGPTRLCASSMSDRCWLRRTPSGSCLRPATRSGSRPVPRRGRARASGRRRRCSMLLGATAPRDGPRTGGALPPGLGGPRPPRARRFGGGDARRHARGPASCAEGSRTDASRRRGADHGLI